MNNVLTTTQLDDLINACQIIAEDADMTIERAQMIIPPGSIDFYAGIVDTIDSVREWTDFTRIAHFSHAVTYRILEYAGKVPPVDECGYVYPSTHRLRRHAAKYVIRYQSRPQPCPNIEFVRGVRYAALVLCNLDHGLRAHLRRRKYAAAYLLTHPRVCSRGEVDPVQMQTMNFIFKN